MLFFNPPWDTFSTKLSIIDVLPSDEREISLFIKDPFPLLPALSVRVWEIEDVTKKLKFEVD
jgi:hypothetical protein